LNDSALLSADLSAQQASVHADGAELNRHEAGLLSKVQQLEAEIERIKEHERLRTERESEKVDVQVPKGHQESLGETVRELERESDRQTLRNLASEGLAQGAQVRNAELEVHKLIKERQKQKQIRLERDLTMMRKLDAASSLYKDGISVPIAPRPQRKRDLETEIRDNPRHLAHQHSWLQPLLQRGTTQVKEGADRQRQVESVASECGDEWM
jgi:hypothetical protein